MAGLWAFRIYDRQKFARIGEEREKERKESFEAFLIKNGEPLKILADTTRIGTKWSGRSTRTTRSGFRRTSTTSLTSTATSANAAWIYPIPTPILFIREILRPEAHPQLPIPSEAFTKLFAPIRTLISLSRSRMTLWSARCHGARLDRRRRTLRGGATSLPAVSGTNRPSRRNRYFPTTRSICCPQASRPKDS